MPLLRKRPAGAITFEAIGVHHTAVDKDGAWDASASLKALGDSPSKEQLRAMHAWVDPAKDPQTKGAYKLPHHEVSSTGSVGAAVLKGVESAMGRLNGGALEVPDADRRGAWEHLAAHYKDAGQDPPDFVEKAAAAAGEYFGRPSEDDDDNGDDESPIAEFEASSADPKKGTIDCVWYGGQTVLRQDPYSGEPYSMNLDMTGCRMDRLNAGAPVFDCHFSGDDFQSMIAGKSGIKAQLGVVQKAWADGKKGKATLRFDMGNPDGAEMFRKAATGIVQNLSFGAWIYKKENMAADGPGKQENPPEGAPPYSNPNEMGMFSATDWEPFEISPVTVPADFSTQFLSATPRAAASPLIKEPPMAEPNNTGTGAAAHTPAELAALREEAFKEERARVASIRAMVGPFKQISEKFTNSLIESGKTVEIARTEIMTELSVSAQKDASGNTFEIREQIVLGKDRRDKLREQMEAALLIRHDPQAYKELAPAAQELRGLSLLDLARESLAAAGKSTRGWSREEVARQALLGTVQRGGAPGAEYFMGGGESTSDFPSILANVANKTLRQAYEAYPRTFQPFCRQVTAVDFKPINRVQLSDAPSLQKLNEKGEYHRANLTDSNQNYSLVTYGEVVAITRKVIINDDLQAFTRVPAILGVAAARLESDVVWAVITGNQVMQVDNVALFNSAHNNLFTGSGSAISLTALSTGRAALRTQTAPGGTPLNLTPRFMIVPAALETSAAQLIVPLDIASTVVTAVVPQWVRSMIPVVEPRLDVASTTAWYLASDAAQIDTIEYCYLEGQQGVYIETRQGFEVDGVEIKARMDFAAAAIDYRGLQKNAGV